jgi:catechol 2,3-dioxygenase-like lactoylglutathione lyase family enzyme
MYRFGEQQLNVHGRGLEPDPVARLPVHPGGSDLCFVWAAPIEAAIDHLRAHQVEVELGPVRRRGARGGGTSVYFRDPDGSLLDLLRLTQPTGTGRIGPPLRTPGHTI